MRNGIARNTQDLVFLTTSRVFRSFATGFLGVIVGLYYLYVLHLSNFLIGVLFSVGAFATPVLSYVLGRYADKYGRKKVLLITLLFLPTATAILTFTSFFPLLLISAALGGFGIAGGLVGAGVGASVAPMQTALLAEKTNFANRTKVFSTFQMIATLSGSAGALLTHIQNYIELFYIAVVLTLISLLLIIPVKENFKPKRVNSVGQSSDLGTLSAEDKSIIKKFTVTGTFTGTAQGLYIPFLAIVFSSYFHASNGEIGNLFALGGVLSALSMSFAPYITKKLGFVKFIIVSRAISAVTSLIVPFSLSFVMASVFYLISTPARGIALPAQSSLMMGLVTEKNRATATSSNQAARLAPSALATALSGYMLDTLPISVPFVASFFFNVSNLFLYQKFFGKISTVKVSRGGEPGSEGALADTG